MKFLVKFNVLRLFKGTIENKGEINLLQAETN